jgi:phenylalanyl-tRNA synthetase alpha chain
LVIYSFIILGVHPILKKKVEIGNSGIFRPEMLRPMGFPEDVSVIAWGLGLERPTMIQFGVQNIKELFGPGVSIKKVKDSQIYCL